MLKLKTICLFNAFNKNQNLFKRCFLINYNLNNYMLLLLLWKNNYILGFNILTPFKILVFFKNIKLHYVKQFKIIALNFTLKKKSVFFLLKPNLLLFCKTKYNDLKFLKKFNKFYI